MHTISALNVAAELQNAIQHHQNGRLEEAATLYQQILRQEPEHADALHLLGVLAYQIGKNPLAVELIAKAITFNPKNAEYYCNLGPALHMLGNLDAAIECYRTALSIQPNQALAHNNLGSALKDKGLLDESLACYRQALALQPDSTQARDNLISVLLLRAGLPPETDDALSASALQYLAEARRYAQQFEAPLKAQWPQHANLADPDKRLKLGYVSGDLRSHAVAYFIEPILAHHDHQKFEIFCYHNSHVKDAVTERIIGITEHWIPCKDMSEDQLAARIMADGIDILVDLSGHTAHNRLLTFARKPAPVQTTWIGLPATTGLEAMDYRLTEAYMDPPGLTDALHTETLVRLPLGAVYQPPADCPDINPLPALGSPVFTLACLNNLAKISPRAIALWSRTLHLLPGARLMLGNARNAQTRQLLLARFAEHGIIAERIVFQPNMPLRDYLALHHEIDLALDPFPYNGGTTTYHSLWMGVPVITLAGKSSISRVGVGVLSNMGLNECIADSEENYIRRTLEYALDLPRLAALRDNLRSKMLAASNASPEQVTAALEQAFRTMWQRWCAERHATQSQPAV